MGTGPQMGRPAWESQPWRYLAAWPGKVLPLLGLFFLITQPHLTSEPLCVRPQLGAGDQRGFSTGAALSSSPLVQRRARKQMRMVWQDKCSSCSQGAVAAGRTEALCWGGKQVCAHRGGDFSPGSEREQRGKAGKMSTSAVSELGLMPVKSSGR